MRFTLPLLAASALLCTSLALAAPSKVEVAHASIVDAKGKKIGTAELMQTPKGVRITVIAGTLAPGQHGIHIHETGKCTAPDFKTAGGHFNPDHKEHGLENPKGSHAGDMPNMTVGKTGDGSFEYVDSHITLTGTGPDSVFKPGGTSIVIHAKMDDEKSNPAGNAGDRVACGIISK